MIEAVPLTDDVILRPATERDAGALLRAYTRNRDHLRRWEPRRAAEFYTLPGQETRLKAVLAQQAAGRAMPWVLTAAGDPDLRGDDPDRPGDDPDRPGDDPDRPGGEEIVGRVTLNTIVRGPFLSADLGYWIDAGHAGRGLTTAAVREVCRMADQDLGLHRLAAGTLLDNAASQSVLRKCGFELFGTAPRYLEIDGRWQDHRLFQRILNDRPAT